MLLKSLLIALSIIIVGVAILGYHPLPDGVQDRYRVHIVMGILKLRKYVLLLKQFLGYGDEYQNVKFPFDHQIKESVPASAAYGGLKVTREKVAGVYTTIYQPKDVSTLLPAIVYFHGGGWSTCRADLFDNLVYEYALRTGQVLFNVDYRLAPDHPFPAPVQDCLDVTRFVLRHGSKYNVDVTRVGVAGESAGANLAAAVAQRLSKEKTDLPPLLFQVLHFPALQAFDMHLPSLVDFNETMPILTTKDMSSYYAFYIGVSPEDVGHYASVISQNRHIPAHLKKSKYAEFVDIKLLPAQYQIRNKPVPAVAATHDEKVYNKIKDVITNPLFSPLMSLDLTGLPPAFIHAAEFDILRDDAFIYARRLEDAGVKVKVYFDKGGFHGNINMCQLLIPLTSANNALSAAYNFIKEILGQ